jgi:hypothetical protein
MNAPAEFTAPAADQALLRSVLRTSLRLLFRGLVRPPMPIAGQRAVLRLLTAAPAVPAPWAGGLVSGTNRRVVVAPCCCICMAVLT